jgi:hypothetical protein
VPKNSSPYPIRMPAPICAPLPRSSTTSRSAIG